MCGYSGYLEYNKQKKKNDVQHISTAEFHHNVNKTVMPVRVGSIRTTAVPTNID